MYDLNIDLLIRNYFNSFFNHKFLHKKYQSGRNRRLSNNKIFVSKPEIKHTNSKAILTLYTYNREKKILLKKILELKKNSFRKIFKTIS